MSKHWDEFTYETAKVLNNPDVIVLSRKPYPEETLYSIYHDEKKMLETHSIQICNGLMWYEIILGEKRGISGVVCYNAKWHRRKARVLTDIYNSVQQQYLKKQNAKAH